MLELKIGQVVQEYYFNMILLLCHVDICKDIGILMSIHVIDMSYDLKSHSLQQFFQYYVISIC